MADIFDVQLSRNAKKDLATIPTYIVKKLRTWIFSVSQNGIIEIRKISSYHDEPLKGNRLGQRSIRLNNSYRAIYEVKNNEIEIEYIEIQEVNNHEY